MHVRWSEMLCGFKKQTNARWPTTYSSLYWHFNNIKKPKTKIPLNKKLYYQLNLLGHMRHEIEWVIVVSQKFHSATANTTTTIYVYVCLSEWVNVYARIHIQMDKNSKDTLGIVYSGCVMFCLESVFGWKGICIAIEFLWILKFSQRKSSNIDTSISNMVFNLKMCYWKIMCTVITSVSNGSTHFFSFPIFDAWRSDRENHRFWIGFMRKKTNSLSISTNITHTHTYTIKSTHTVHEWEAHFQRSEKKIEEKKKN